MSYGIKKVMYLNTNTKSEKARKMAELATAFKDKAFTDYDALTAFVGALRNFAADLDKAYPKSRPYVVKVLHYGNGWGNGDIEVIPEGANNAYKSGYIVRIQFVYYADTFNPFYFEDPEFLAMVDKIKKGGEQ